MDVRRLCDCAGIVEVDPRQKIQNEMHATMQRNIQKSINNYHNKRPRAIFFLGLLIGLSLPSIQAYLTPIATLYYRNSFPDQTLRPNHHHISVSTKTTSRLYISTIRTWFSFASAGKGHKQQTRPKPKQKASKASIFYKEHPQNDNNQTKFDKNTTYKSFATDINSTGILSEKPLTEWDNALNADDKKAILPGNLSDSKREAVQYGIFSPSSSLRSLPGYTSNWANTLSSTLHSTTSNAWSKMTINPMQVSSQSPISPNSSLQALGIPSYLRPTDTLTVADLQAILERNALQQQRITFVGGVSNMSGGLSTGDSRKTQPDPIFPSQSQAAQVTPSRKSKQGVAFPQPSVLDYKSLQRGTAVASALIGMVVATTLLPNLWLMGLIAGAIYGNDICSRPHEPPPTNLLARTLIAWGRRLSRVTLQFMDNCRTLWFLYKTGQLSYQYYRQYEAIDQRFAIQSKIDAWNARFQEGKRQFDTWEQENEIGRTVLASLRTVWLVDEQAKRRAKQKSRYRLVQSLYDAKYWIARWYQKIWKVLNVSTWNQSLRDYLEGIRTDLMKSTGGSWGTRIGAVAASLIAVNITGALFAISPMIMGLFAIGVGVAWPSWVSELVARINTLIIETRARGRGEDTAVTDFTLQQLNTARLLGRYDKSKYHFFRREDGTKRFYRTGQSLFKVTRKEKQASKSSTALAWPWTKPQRLRRHPGKEQWGVFFTDYFKSNT